MKQKILKYALQNAIKFNGKANIGAVMGKLIQEDPSVKDRLSEIKPEIEKTIEELSRLTVEQQKEKLEQVAPELLEEKRKERKKELPLLKNNTADMVMRFAPSPSGPLHIGHAYVLSLNSEFCRKYKGKLLIRIEDTNPENIYEPAYELIPKDAEWVTKGNIGKVIIQSDRLEKYYKVAEELVKQGNAYVCTCDPEKFKELAKNMQPCPCRSLKNNLQRWKDMFTKYKQGEAVLRIKTDINHKNPAMRDWPAARINESKHPRAGKKYKVWPLMNLSVAVDDHELKVTHTVRGKDHMDNEKRQKYIFDYMGWQMPEHLYLGRINFTGMEVSCSKTRPLVEKKIYSGWDDIRLPFLVALKRRGYQPEAFIKYALDVGITQNDKTVSKEEFFKTLNAFNKEIIDPIAERYFFVEDPVKVKIENSPDQGIELDLQPDNKKGGRLFKVKDEFYLTKKDYDELKEDSLCRLMGCLNFVKKGKKLIFDSLEYEKYKDKGKKIIHWLPASKSNVKVEVLMGDGRLVKGVGESTLNKLEVNNIIQFERSGFCRLDKKGKNKLVFWFAHQ